MPFEFEIPKTPSGHKDEKVSLSVIDADGEKTISVWKGYRLWDAMLDAKADFWKLCGGDGVCSTCRVEVLEGEENLSPKSWFENLSLKGHLISGENMRLACQTYINGPARVRWNKLFFQPAMEKILPPHPPAPASGARD